MEATKTAPAAAPGTGGPLPETHKLRRKIRWSKYFKVSVGGTMLILFCLIALLAPVLAPHDPTVQSLPLRLKPPAWQAAGSWEYVLGTDQLGRDLLSRLMFASRVSLLVGVVTVVVSGCIGITLGLLAGYYTGRTDMLIGKLVEIIQSIPFLLMAIAMMAFLGQGLWNLILVLGLNRWTQYCRVVRGEVLSLREREFIQAARSLGAPDWQILLRHVLPNTISSVTVIATFAVATVILSEASLSFLGLGVPVEVPTWGAMLAEGRTYIYRAVWLTLYPGLAIFLTVLSVNLLGDGLRDLLDPKQRRT